MKRISVCMVAMIMLLPCIAHATNESVVTTKGYVDSELESKQAMIPAAGASGVGIGTSVVTYTNTAGGGVIGERQLYTDASSYTAGSDADKLITGSALNGAFTSLPTTDTTKLTCANAGCTLWTISTQTAYGIDPVTALLNALRTTNGSESGSNALNGTLLNSSCVTDLGLGYGSWCATFNIDEETVHVSGISACSTTYTNQRETIASSQVGVQTDYESGITAAPTSSPAGRYCYCKVTNPSVSTAYWWYLYAGEGTYPNADAKANADCAKNCASVCGRYFKNYAYWRIHLLSGE